VNIALFSTKASCCSKDAPQKGKSELCSNAGYNRCIWLTAFFRYFFGQSFFDSGAFWCYPATCEEKKVEPRLLNVKGGIYPSLFHVVGRSVKGIYQNNTEVGCVIQMSKNVFSQLFRSPLAETSNLALSAVLNFFQNRFH